MKDSQLRTSALAPDAVADVTANRPAVAGAAGRTNQTDRFIREGECLRISGLSRTTRWRLERQGTFPPRRQLSNNAVGWSLVEVLEWKASRPISAAQTLDPTASSRAP
jgi:prophage regulatory protein